VALSASQPNEMSKRSQASSCIVTMIRPFAVAGSKAMIQASLLSDERTTTKACLPSSDQTGARKLTSRSFGCVLSFCVSALFSVFCSPALP
jgi:hypothetical protein